MTAPYTVLIVTPKRSVWAKLRGHRDPAPVQVWPLCPACAQPVNAWEPRIREGAEYYDSRRVPVSWKEPDEVKGFTLKPCGDVVEHVAWMRATAR